MKDVTGTMAGLGHVPRSARRGLYGLATIVFRFVELAVMDVAFIESFNATPKFNSISSRSDDRKQLVLQDVETLKFVNKMVVHQGPGGCKLRISKA